MRLAIAVAALCLAACADKNAAAPAKAAKSIPEADFTLSADNTHNKFSRLIPPVLTVPPGSVIETETKEASGQLTRESTADTWRDVDKSRIHALTGPIFVEGAAPGDILAVTLLDLEPEDWAWTVGGPDNGFLGAEEESLGFKIYSLDKERNVAKLADGVEIPLAPFAGVMAVAPDTDEMLSTAPPRANGGNLDDPHLVAGTTVYLPIFVEGALFSIGDTHAVQGMGEIAGAAAETPMRVRFRLDLIRKGETNYRTMAEPQYETAEYYATTGFGTTIEEAAKKASRYMLDHLVETRGMPRSEAYMLCSLACDLMIAEVVDKPHMLVAMHLRKDIFVDKGK